METPITDMLNILGHISRSNDDEYLMLMIQTKDQIHKSLRYLQEDYENYPDVQTQVREIQVKFAEANRQFAGLLDTTYTGVASIIADSKSLGGDFEARKQKLEEWPGISGRARAKVTVGYAEVILSLEQLLDQLDLPVQQSLPLEDSYNPYVEYLDNRKY